MEGATFAPIAVARAAGGSAVSRDDNEVLIGGQCGWHTRGGRATLTRVGCRGEVRVGESSSAAEDRWHLRTVPEHLADRYRAEGWWDDDTLGDLVARGLGRRGDVAFQVRSALRPWQGTFADVDASARRLAGALRADGVGPGDVVVFQLPNWVEAGITFFAAAYLGAVVVPIVHFY